MKSNLLLRAFSGVILVAVVVLLIWWNSYSRFFILSLIGIAGCFEFLTIFKKSGGVNISRCFAILAASTILLCSFFNVPLTIPIALLFLLRGIFELYRKSDKPLESMAYESLAILYTIFPMLLLCGYDMFAIFAVLIFVWTNDVGAYLVGSMIGKHRLFERLSPKKSWEGFWGGFVLAVAAGYAYWAITDTESVLYWIVLASVISVAAVFGDLFESMLKRSVGIKDSGAVIPGHGGVLDRFDALYFAALALFLVDRLFVYITI